MKMVDQSRLLIDCSTWSLQHASLNWGGGGGGAGGRHVSKFHHLNTSRTLGDPRDPIKKAPEDFFCMYLMVN